VGLREIYRVGITKLQVPLFGLLPLQFVRVTRLPEVDMSCQVVRNALIVMCGHPNDCPAAHGTYLDLEEPAAEACLMKHMLAVRDLHDFFAGCLIEGLQADAAVKIL
jgi:hypothetical protein